MADSRLDQLPDLPEWMKRYDISVGPYDQPVPLPVPERNERNEDKAPQQGPSLDRQR